MHRRTALLTIGTACWSSVASPSSAPADDAVRPTGLGLLNYSQSLRRSQRLKQNGADDLFEPFTFLAQAAEFGASGIQTGLGVLSDERAAALQMECARRRMFLEAQINLPKSSDDLDRFRAEMRSASRAGARAVRTVAISGRRYESYASREAFRAAEAEARRMLERATPVAEELRLPLAVENHKDQRIEERLTLLEQLSSEYVGACVDTGNSLSLLEDPLEVIRAYAPWARAVHFKDQALQRMDDGFLLADIPLGQGALDLHEIVRILREQQPGLPMCLELLTRDALVVPCLSESYWRPMGDWPARDLARTLRLVRERAAEHVQQVSRLSPEEQVELETRNVQQSFEYARRTLPL